MDDVDLHRCLFGFAIYYMRADSPSPNPLPQAGEGVIRAMFGAELNPSPAGGRGC